MISTPAFRSLALQVILSAALVGGPSLRAAQATAVVGQTVTFSVTADGTAPFAYQWRKGTGGIAGATGATYTISAVSTADSGSYNVVVSNSAGSTVSDVAALTVNAPPAFTLQPASQTVTAGSAVTFTAAASGTPAPTYQWLFNGVAIPNATGASYLIASAAAGNAGTYAVVAANAAGTVTSRGAVLAVNPLLVAPAITSQPVSQTVNVGASVTFSAAASGNPAPTYQWRRNGVSIVGATRSSYTITSVTTADAGTYSVVASNSVGSATSNGAGLTVRTPPMFTTQPLSQTATAGLPVSLLAAASGSPSPTYQWFKDGKKLTGATNPSYSIASVGPANAGTYTVVAANSAGSATSRAATLTVTGTAPAFTLQPASWTVKAGASVTLTVAASGTPAPTYQWLKNGKPIAGATGAAYTLIGVSTSSAATYSVVATNAFGSGTSSGAVLTVIPAASVVPKDFNFDGYSDIVWQNTATGEGSIWLMDGTLRTGTVSLGTAGAGWSIAGIGDFNSDGNPDILWQNSTTGQRIIWLMNGTTQAGTVDLGIVSTDWTIAAAGDIDGDGEPDIIWQNTVTGERSIWLMSGTKQATVVSLGVVDTAWSIAGAGDLNGDGRADILWQNAVTGECSVWLMAGPTSITVVSLGYQPAGWAIAGTGEFDGTGKTDILWQNRVTGERVIWLLSGVVRTGGTSSGVTPTSVVSLGTVDLNWSIRD